MPDNTELACLNKELTKAKKTIGIFIILFAVQTLFLGGLFTYNVIAEGKRQLLEEKLAIQTQLIDSEARGYAIYLNVCAAYKATLQDLTARLGVDFKQGSVADVLLNRVDEYTGMGGGELSPIRPKVFTKIPLTKGK